MLRETGQWLHSLDPQAVAALRGYHIPEPAPTTPPYAIHPQQHYNPSTTYNRNDKDAHNNSHTRRPSTSGSVDAHVTYLAHHLAAHIPRRDAAPSHTGGGGGPPLYRDPIYNHHRHISTEEDANGLVRDTNTIPAADVRTPQRNPPLQGGGRARRFSPSIASALPDSKRHPSPQLPPPLPHSPFTTTTTPTTSSTAASTLSPLRRRYHTHTTTPPNTSNYSAVTMKEGDSSSSTWTALAKVAKDQAEVAYNRRREEGIRSILKYQMVPSSKRDVPTLDRDPRSLLDPSLLDDNDDGEVDGDGGGGSILHSHLSSTPFASIHESGKRIQATNQAISDARSGFSPAYVHGLRPTTLDLERPLAVYNVADFSRPSTTYRVGASSPIKATPTSRPVEVAVAIPPCDTLRSLRYKSARGELRQQERIRRENEAILYRLTPQCIVLLNHLQEDEAYERETNWMDWSRDFVDILTQSRAERDEASGRTRFREQMELSRIEMDERVYIKHLYKGEVEELGALLSIMDAIIRPFCVLAEGERLDRAQVVFVEGRYWEDIIKKEWESRAANPAFAFERDVYRRVLMDKKEHVLDTTIMKLSGLVGGRESSNLPTTSTNRIIVSTTSTSDSHRHHNNNHMVVAQQQQPKATMMVIQSPPRLRPLYEASASPIRLLDSHSPYYRRVSSSTSSIVGDADCLESDDIGMEGVVPPLQSASMSPIRPRTNLPSPRNTIHSGGVTPTSSTDPLGDYVTSYWSKELRGGSRVEHAVVITDTPPPSAAVETRRDHSPSRFGDIHREQRYPLEERPPHGSHMAASPITTWRGEAYRHEEATTNSHGSDIKHQSPVPAHEVVPSSTSSVVVEKRTLSVGTTPPHQIVEAVHTPSPYKNRHPQPTTATTPPQLPPLSSSSPSAGLVDFLYEKVSLELAKELASRRQSANTPPNSSNTTTTTTPKQQVVGTSGHHNVNDSSAGNIKGVVTPSSKSIRSASGVIVGPYEDDIGVTLATPRSSNHQESVGEGGTSYPTLKSPKRGGGVMVSPARGGNTYSSKDVVREASELLDQSPPQRRQQHKTPVSSSYHQGHTSPKRSLAAPPITSPPLAPVSVINRTPSRLPPSPHKKLTPTTIQSPHRATTPQGPTLHTTERAMSRNRQHSSSIAALTPPHSGFPVMHQQQHRRPPLRAMYAPDYLPSLGTVPHADPTTESLVGTEGSYLSLFPGDDNIDAPVSEPPVAASIGAAADAEVTIVTPTLPTTTSSTNHNTGGGGSSSSSSSAAVVHVVPPSMSDISSSSSYCEAISIMARRHRQDPKTMQRALEAKYGYKGSKHEYAVNQAMLDYEKKMVAFEASRSRVVVEKTNRHQIRSYPQGVQTEGGLPLELHIKDRVNNDDIQPPTSSHTTPSPQEVSIPHHSVRRGSMGLNRDSPSSSATVKTGVGSRTAIMGDLLLKSDVELIFPSPAKEVRNMKIDEQSQQQHQPSEEDYHHHRDNSLSAPHCPASTATRSSTSHIRSRREGAPGSTVSSPHPQPDAFSLEDIAEGRVDLLMSPPSHVNHHRDDRPLEDVCHKDTSPPRPYYPSSTTTRRQQYLEEEY